MPNNMTLAEMMATRAKGDPFVDAGQIFPAIGRVAEILGPMLMSTDSLYTAVDVLDLIHEYGIPTDLDAIFAPEEDNNGNVA